MRTTDFYDRWLAIWNGDTALASELLTPDCLIHQAPFGPGDPPVFHGPEGLVQMVEQGRAPFRDLIFRVEVGPLREGDLMAGRWISEGRYAGGMPGASAEPGARIVFRGSDLFRLDGDRIAEYWVSSDGVHLMAQLGMLS